jgi:transposase
MRLLKAKMRLKWPIESERNPQTVMEWVHRYNTHGPEALTYRRSGGHLPLCLDEVKRGVDQTIRQALEVAATPPQQRREEPLPRWTLKRLVQWVKETKETFAIDCSRETLRKLLKELGFSWKKARKLLNKANPDQRAAFLKTLEGLLDDALHERCSGGVSR